MKLKDVKTYWRIWLRLTKLQFATQIANSRGSATVFLFGKIMRVVFVFIFTTIVISKAQSLSGYNLPQAIFILALFVWGSTFSQLFFRGVYMFRQKVQDGTFDFYLLSPLNPLFYSLFSYTDALDLLLMLPYTYLVGWAWLAAGYSFTLFGVSIFLLCVLAMFIFVLAIHILVIAIGVRYLEVDNLIMLYRDIEKMAFYPIDIYGKFVGGFLTYVLPFAVIATIPAKIIFGYLHPLVLVAFLFLAYLELRFALWYWRRSLGHYTSASS